MNDPINAPEVPASPAANPTPPPAPAAPPAARIVVEGGKTERELQLEAELDSERKGRVTEAERAKRAEIKAAEEENARLQAEERLKANSIPRPPKRKRLFSTLFKD